MLDMTESIAPKSDQMNADDLMSGPRTFTIAEVRKAPASSEQPFDFVLVEFPAGRPFKPSKSMRRIMVLAWGPDASTYAGKRLTLYRDPTVRFGGQDVGGIRISAVSHISEPLTVALTVTRGRRAPYRVDVLASDQPTSPAVHPDTLAELNVMFDRKGIAETSRLAGVNRITGGSATDLEVITEDEARQVLHALASRPDAPVESDNARQMREQADQSWTQPEPEQAS